MSSVLQAAYNELASANSRMRAALEMSELARDRALAEVERLQALCLKWQTAHERLCVENARLRVGGPS